MIDFGKWAFANRKLVYFVVAVLLVGGILSAYDSLSPDTKSDQSLKTGIELLKESAVWQWLDGIVVCPESPGQKDTDNGESDVPDEPLASLGAVVVHVSPTNLYESH